MILLESHNRVIEEILMNKFTRKEPLDISLADFDGIQYHISTPDSDDLDIVLVSVSMKCYKDLKKFAVVDLLKRVYGSLLESKAEKSYDVSIKLDYKTLKSSDTKTIIKVASLRRNLFSAPFEQYFDAVKMNKKMDPAMIRYREHESWFLVPTGGDRLTVVFSVLFADADDAVLAKVFLQEFIDARRRINNAPQVSYSKDPPMELQGMKLKDRSNVSYVSIILFKGHMEGNIKEKSLTLIPSFRDYLHYHIKCAKAFLHTRMRKRVSSMLLLLNKAKPAKGEDEKVRKTYQGKTFVRRS